MASEMFHNMFCLARNEKGDICNLLPKHRGPHQVISEDGVIDEEWLVTCRNPFSDAGPTCILPENHEDSHYGIQTNGQSLTWIGDPIKVCGEERELANNYWVSCSLAPDHDGAHQSSTVAGGVVSWGNSMKSKTNQFAINALKRVNLGVMPLFLQLAHKGLEKAMPEPIYNGSKTTSYLVPKDVLRVAITDPSIYEKVESIELTYDHPDVQTKK